MVGPPGPPDFGRLVRLTDHFRSLTARVCLRSEWGHVGGCFGAVELLTVLYFAPGLLRIDPENPRAPGRDQVLVRGHLGPLRYGMFAALGWVEESELDHHAELGSRLGGHEDHQLLPGVDIGPSGSLGMLLSYGAGAALAARRAGQSFRTFVFLGDGEEQEGVVGEAARHAASIGLANLVCVIDRNGYQLSGSTGRADGACDLAGLWASYGWSVVSVADGHDLEAVHAGLTEAIHGAAAGPTVVIADTVKGHGLPEPEAHFGYHELSHLTPDAQRALEEWAAREDLRAAGELVRSVLAAQPAWTPVPPRRIAPSVSHSWSDLPTATSFDEAQIHVFRELAAISAVPDGPPLFFLTADTFPERLFERAGLERSVSAWNVGIREQHAVALAHGVSAAAAEAIIVVHIGDAFSLRCMDQLAAARYAGVRFLVIGDDAGVTNDRNGPTHQNPSVPSAVASLPGVRMLEPATAQDLAAAVDSALQADTGVAYLRLHDGPFPQDGLPFLEGDRSKAYLVRDGDDPQGVFVAAGFATLQCHEAVERLALAGRDVRLVNVVDHGALDSHVCEWLVHDRPVLAVADASPRTLAEPLAIASYSRSRRPRSIAGIGFEKGASARCGPLCSALGLDPDSLAAAMSRAIDGMNPDQGEDG